VGAQLMDAPRGASFAEILARADLARNLL
jgi:hypothetical protein